MPEFASILGTVAIVGPGLIGGSFGLALKHAAFKGTILGVGEEPYILKALEVGAIDRVSSLPEALETADLVYLSGTVHQILEVLRQIGELARSGCRIRGFITDVGSTKSEIVEQASIHLPPGQFVGGHPMAGKEKRGAEHAEATLFCDRPYILTGQLETAAFAAFIGILQELGCRIIYLDAKEHDRTVAFSSHLPQLLATALAFTLAEQSELPISGVYSSGLADMTRLALSSSALWQSILATNRENVISSVDTYIANLQNLRDEIATSKLIHIFEKANQYAYLLRTELALQDVILKKPSHLEE